MASPFIWIVDTSIFLNLLDLPGRNQHRKALIGDFRSRIEAGGIFILPIATIVESGNHIANHKQLSGNQRRHYADQFAVWVREALVGEAPWRVHPLPDGEALIRMLADFPDAAMRAESLGDHILVKTWEQISRQYPSHQVFIWSLDAHLQAYAGPP